MNPASNEALQGIIARFPTPRDEDWKYTDLAPAREIASRWIAAGKPVASTDLATEIDAITRAIDAHWFVFANGRITVAATADALDHDTTAPIATDENPLGELNIALLHECLRLRIKGVPDKPIGLLFADAAGEVSVTQTRVDVDIAPGSRAELIEYHWSHRGGEHYAHSRIDVRVGDDANLAHLRIQSRDRAHIQTTATRIDIGRNGSLAQANFDLGGRLVRNDLSIELSAKGAEVAFDGLYLAGDDQHIDNHTRVDHRVGPATSRQEYRGILNGRCRCVWNGKVVVHEGADGTDGDQSNHNLVLSEKAEIDTKPELEIYADDVKCSHGTTVGQLDETALFYLRSRGLDRRHATQVLTHAFAAGLVSRVPVTAAIDAVERLVTDRLAILIDDPVARGNAP